MSDLLNQLRTAFTQLEFVASDQYYWSPEGREIYYKRDAHGEQNDWSLLHETGHALLKHRQYRTDFELLKLEVAAWDKAREIALHFGITISEDHIQDCLDTYRDWLHARSTCPTCSTKCLQQDDRNEYACFNCGTRWAVGANRFCRTYRSVQQTAAA